MAVLSKRAPKVSVFINRQLNKNAHCLSATLTAGGRTLPTATIIIQPTLRASGRGRVFNGNVTQFPQAEVEIVVHGRVNSIIHWGKVLANQTQIEPTGDSIVLVSRIDDQHFGQPLQYTYFYNRNNRRIVAVDLPTVFNPDYDGRSAPNMAGRLAGGDPFFLHPESSRTVGGIEWNDSGRPQYWTLRDAVFYLCRALNTQQTYIQNPTRRQLEAVLPNDDSLVRNHQCRTGAFLPAQLDDLLEPYGYSWTVDFLARGRRQIRVFKRGAGTRGQFQLQAPGSVTDMNLSSLESLSLNVDVADRAFNEVSVLGDFELRESTFELVPAWPQKYDTHDIAKLQKNHADWTTTPALERVWRDWVLNEAGDYVGHDRSAIKRAYNFGPLFGTSKWFPRRRKFEPCLTLNRDLSPKGHVAGVFVEWFDRNGGNAWRTIDELGPEGRTVRVLERECGIRFDGMEIPAEIRAQGIGYAKIRVTASVRSDSRLFSVRRAFQSILKEVKREVVDVSSRFKFQKREKTSRFDGGEFKAESADDQLKAQKMADQLLDAWNSADLSGRAVVTGIDYNFAGAIGQTISGINGRKVSFQCGGSVPKFPCTMSIHIRPQDQQCDWHLDTSRGDIDYFDRHTEIAHGKRKARR